MKVLFATDGSPTAKKALAFSVTHDGVMGPDGELIVLNVQTPAPRFNLVGKTCLAAQISHVKAPSD